MADTALGNIIGFFKELGVYDVVLPFILVFTIMFAILERSKMFGTEGEKEYTKKNLNAMVSFVVAFMVVASSQLVATITRVSSQVMVLLLLVVFFLMLVGTFRTKEEIKEGKLLHEKPWQIGFMVTIVIVIVLIFLNAVVLENGSTWLDIVVGWLGQFYTNSAVAAILLIIGVIVFIAFVTSEKGEK